MPNKSKLEKICEFAKPIETIIDINGKMINIYFCDILGIECKRYNNYETCAFRDRGLYYKKLKK